MGFKAGSLLLFPISVMMVAILLSGGSSPVIQGSGGATFCNPNEAASNCVNTNSPGVSYYCQADNVLGLLQACKILPSCTTTPTLPAFCIQDFLTSISAGCSVQFLTSGSAGCGVYLPAGSFVFIPTSTIAADLSTSGGFFGFTVSGVGGFISMIGVAVGLVCLAGFTVFGSGENSESLHILFMGGMLMGFWMILSGLEGFVGGSQASVFTQLNNLPSPLAGAGTFIYVAFLTLPYTVGVVASVSRGGN